MIFRNQGSLIKKSSSISKDELRDLYGLNSYEFTQTTKEEIFVCSKNKELDLIELDQLLQTVGWSKTYKESEKSFRFQYFGGWVMAS